MKDIPMTAKHPASQPDASNRKALVLAGIGGYLLAIATYCLFYTTRYNQIASDWLLSWVGLEIGNSTSWSSEPKDEEETDQSTVETSISCIVLFLISLTIAFEKAKHHILHTAERDLRPAVEALFGEMTVLGFVSAIAFTLTQCGVFSFLSEKLFHEDGLLLELFELVHYFLFLVMIFFVGLFLLLIHEATAMEREWLKMDRACNDNAYMMKFLEKNRNDLTKPPPNWPKYLYRIFFSKTNAHGFERDLMVFYGLRKEFLLERSSEAPFEPAGNRLDESFNFGRYLSVCLGHTLEKVVEVYPITWGCFMVLTLIYGTLCLISSDASTFAWIWALSGWAVFFFGNVFDYHIERLLYALETPQVEGDKTHYGAVATIDYTRLPAWCHVNLEKYQAKRSFLTKWISLSPPSRRDTLYWFEKKGPSLYLIIFQFRLVFLSAYYALLFLSFYPSFLKEHSLWRSMGYILFSITPAILLKIHNRRSVANMAVASSLGDHRRPQSVACAIREEKTEQLIRSLVIVEKMHRSAVTNVDDPTMGDSDELGTSSRRIDSQELVEVERIFNTFEVSGDGAIQSTELQRLMDALGVAMTTQSIDAMVQHLDIDGDGEISRDEFVAFYASKFSTHHDKRSQDLHELGQFMFRLFDQDGSGGVTLSEFKDVLDALNVEFSIDEVGDLVNELDEHNRGMVGEKEFIALLERHAHLFEKSDLPPII